MSERNFAEEYRELVERIAEANAAAAEAGEEMSRAQRNYLKHTGISAQCQCDLDKLICEFLESIGQKS